MIVLGSPRELRSFRGLLHFLALSVDLGRLDMRRFQHWLASRWDHTLPSIDLSLSVTPDLLDSNWDMVGYKLDTPRSTLVKW